MIIIHATVEATVAVSSPDYLFVLFSVFVIFVTHISSTFGVDNVNIKSLLAKWISNFNLHYHGT